MLSNAFARGKLLACTDYSRPSASACGVVGTVSANERQASNDLSQVVRRAVGRRSSTGVSAALEFGRLTAPVALCCAFWNLAHRAGVRHA